LNNSLDRIYVFDAQKKNFKFNQKGKIGGFVDYRCFRIQPAQPEKIIETS